MEALAYPHITLQSDGVPVITGTQTKVVEIVLDRLAWHWDADEIQRQHPDLTLAQIHAALCYYYDHQQDIDADIERRMARVEDIKAKYGDSSLRQKLRAMGKLP